MTSTWKAAAVCAVVLFAAGWFAHALANGPPPDVTALLEEVKAKAGQEAAARDSAYRKQTADSIKALQQSIENSRTKWSNAKAEARQASVVVAQAQAATDTALGKLEKAGTDIEALRQAFLRERAANLDKATKDSTALAAKEAEADSLRRLSAIILAGRARDSSRIDELRDLNRRTADALKKASRKGLDPAVTLSYSPGCDNLTVGGSVRVLGAIRGGLHVETKKCAP